ncbi:MAG TPA: gamma-butyrobetaine hydroxylase-like domain-containing protein, partial [Spirillospora sp.]|nr:gamma-butyrobetaine hydroxylase-like domain-containing protein [Spirillospora sp.]
MTIRPTSITLNKQAGYLEIQWNDGQVCQYPLSHLREACPCVECRGGHQYMGPAYDPDNLLELKPKRSYTITGLDMV